MGWLDTDLELCPTSQRTRTDSDALVQTWLFFGILKTTFGPLFEPAEFVRRKSTGDLLISTLRLRSLWEDFGHFSTTMKGRDLLQHRETVRVNLERANAIFRGRARYRQDRKDEGLGTAKQNLVEISILLLCDYLKHAMRFPGDTFVIITDELGVFQTHMEEDGWCPSQISRLSREMDLQSLYHVSHLPRPDPAVSHAKCTSTDCSGMNVDMTDYVTKHYGDYDCPFQSVDKGALYNDLKNGNIPIAIFAGPPGLEQVRTMPASASAKYVAISHVWAHGLGNPDDNALPECQLRRLQAHVNELYPTEDGPIPFWIDTLSCPTEPEEATDLAIVKMRSTYADADKVLVVDSYLTDIQFAAIGDFECLLRIICSSWMLRLWTLQEALLAKKLYFQFADEAVNIDDIYQSLTSDAFEDEYADIAMKIIELRDVFHQVEKQSTDSTVYLLSRAVRYRSTSVPNDEALCLGTLAKMDMEEIAESEDDDRMRKFWSLVPRYSSLVLFGPENVCQLQGIDGRLDHSYTKAIWLLQQAYVISKTTTIKKKLNGVMKD